MNCATYCFTVRGHRETPSAKRKTERALLRALSGFLLSIPFCEPYSAYVFHLTVQLLANVFKEELTFFNETLQTFLGWDSVPQILSDDKND